MKIILEIILLITGEVYIAKHFCVLSVVVYFLVIGHEDQIKPTQGRFEKGYQQKGVILWKPHFSVYTVFIRV